MAARRARSAWLLIVALVVVGAALVLGIVPRRRPRGRR